MKLLKCSEVLAQNGCDYIAHGEMDDDVLEEMIAHIRDQHPDSELAERLSSNEDREQSIKELIEILKS